VVGCPGVNCQVTALDAGVLQCQQQALACAVIHPGGLSEGAVLRIQQCREGLQGRQVARPAGIHQSASDNDRADEQ